MSRFISEGALKDDDYHSSNDVLDSSSTSFFMLDRCTYEVAMEVGMKVMHGGYSLELSLLGLILLLPDLRG